MVDYTTAAAAQETQLIDRQNALSVQQSRLANAVSLIADLGGGWSDSPLHDP
jgi:outer membrane protein TolC